MEMFIRPNKIDELKNTIIAKHIKGPMYGSISYKNDTPSVPYSFSSPGYESE